MRCDKRGWANEHSARRKLTEIRRKRDRCQAARKVEVRAYQCPHCQHWHLTSHTEDYTLPSRRRPLKVYQEAEEA